MISSMARKHYTDEFRRQAVDLYEQTEGATLSGIAGDLGLARGTLAAWVATFGRGTTTSAGSPPEAPRGAGFVASPSSRAAAGSPSPPCDRTPA